MKSYPVIQGEMWGLGGLGFGATLAFSTAAGLIGFYFDTAKDLSLAQGVDLAIIAYWDAIKNAALIGSAVCAITGMLFVGIGAFSIYKIINRTEFFE